MSRARSMLGGGSSTSGSGGGPQRVRAEAASPPSIPGAPAGWAVQARQERTKRRTKKSSCKPQPAPSALRLLRVAPGGLPRAAGASSPAGTTRRLFSPQNHPVSQLALPKSPSAAPNPPGFALLLLTRGPSGLVAARGAGRGTAWPRLHPKIRAAHSLSTRWDPKGLKTSTKSSTRGGCSNASPAQDPGTTSRPQTAPALVTAPVSAEPQEGNGAVLTPQTPPLLAPGCSHLSAAPQPAGELHRGDRSSGSPRARGWDGGNEVGFFPNPRCERPGPRADPSPGGRGGAGVLSGKALPASPPTSAFN